MALKHGRILRIPVRGLLVALSLCGLSLSAQARYVSPTPPVGFTGTPGGFSYTPPTPLEQLDSIRRESAGKPSGWYKTPGPTLPGGAGKPPAAMRFGGGAARSLAGAAARGLIPGVGLALGLAWLASHCFEKQGSQWVRTCGVGDPLPVSTGVEYQASFGTTRPWYQSRELGCNEAEARAFADTHAGHTWNSHWLNGSRCVVRMRRPDGALTNFEFTFRSRPAGCPAGTFVGADGQCYPDQPSQDVTIPQIEDEMELKPLPNVLPAFVPYPLWTPDDGAPDPIVFPWPTVVNPNRTYEDSMVPTPQTWRQPQGSPKVNPNTGKTEQPVTDWKHKPSTDDPWRMETEPGKVETTDPEGQTEPGTTEDVGEGAKPENKPKPESDTQDLCEKNPGILACADVPELDTPEGEIPKEDRDVEFQEDNVLGSGSCPANVMTSLATLGGRSVTLVDWSQLCTWSLPLRALVLALASLTALFILMPGGVRE